MSRTRRGGEGWEIKIDQELIRQFAISLFENVECSNDHDHQRVLDKNNCSDTEMRSLLLPVVSDDPV